MRHSWREAANIWSAVMRECFLFVCILVVSFRAVAFVVIDQILATARLARILGTIRNVDASAGAVVSEFLGKATVANTLVVIDMCTCGFIQVIAPSMGTTVVVLAVIHVNAACLSGKLPICLAT
jgi:hypothetical protein